jgi:hypothetical protein
MEVGLWLKKKKNKFLDFPGEEEKGIPGQRKDLNLGNEKMYPGNRKAKVKLRGHF